MYKNKSRSRITFFLIVVTILIVLSVNSYPQALSPQKTLIMGIRTPSRYVDDTEIKTGPPKVVKNYCEKSLHKIQNILQGENNSPNVKREYIDNYDLDDEPYPRYQGLEKGTIQIDCGSEVIGDSTNNKIYYSNSFFENGLKLLIKKESFEKVTNKKILPKSELIEEIKKNEVYIGIFKKRINVAKILKEQGFINYKKYDNDLQLKSDLDHGEIQAYVDDSLSIAEFFSEFIRNSDESQNKFLIYPPEQKYYLFDGGNAKLRYVFAFAANAENLYSYQNKINNITNLNTDEMKTTEEKLADEAQRLSQDQNWYSILNQIMDFLKSLIPYQTLFGAILLALITSYDDKKSGVKFKIPDFIAKVKELKTGLDSWLSK
jgi:hypothetical protein